ncbi:SCP2 sterol-binding domain-containing protein [Nitrincola alkalilacustris]|uniref:SCP2 sterol-binding domain-containing protein n=1 Tax=Nitrincola alkalilacustris TaxID=1571224 RepID=UPI0023F47EA7|nr:SCP2 sterol-binding domain-containing protein [Nitrincola alkalilacustris]
MKRLLRTRTGQKLIAALLKLNAWRYTWHYKRSGLRQGTQQENTQQEVTEMADLNAIFSSMGERFNAQAASGLDAVFQYQIEDGEPWAVVVSNGTCEISQGEHDSPTVTLNMDSQTLEEVMNGETDGMQAFMAGRIRADGDIMLATRLASLFPVS